MRCTALDPFADHFFSGRGLEPLAIDVPPQVTANQAPATRLVAHYLNASAGNVWRVQQVHGAAVCAAAATPRVNEEDEWPTADALVTDRSDLVLTVRTADCVPVLMVDPVRHVVAAVHAGWRGLASRVIPATVAHLQSRYGVPATDVVAAVGPSIGPTRYEVCGDVRRAFLQAGHDEAACSRWFRPITAADPDRSADGRYLLDMWQASRDALMAAGVLTAHIHVASLCTATHVSVFHSYRVEGTRSGRMINAIRPNRVLQDVA